ncbi:hypothetical protein [Arcobacter sp. LA11]|uniref:hypothetical protein n=1 Tax=Arcobacter sp. LA11 TaxID=1898176 RepID=UPI000932F3FA|nr:hypothetical protein [Arcobacter sp. LA11]
MNKFYFLSSLLFLILFTGCGPKTSALNYFQEDPLSANAIQYTKKRDLNYKNETKAQLFATYLNKIDKKYQTEKLNSFIIGIHLVNKDKHDLTENGYKVFLNNEIATSIVKLDNKSKLVESIPLKNSWANYYLVHFNKKEEEVKSLNLKLSHSTFGQVLIDFQK